MFVLHQNHRSSSPASMAFEQESNMDHSSRKRKRGSDCVEDSMAHSLSILASVPSYQNLPTPPHSSFSTTAELPFHSTEILSPPLVPRALARKGDDHASKRPHLTAKTRRPRLVVNHPSSYSIDTVSATTAASNAPCYNCRRQPTTLSELAAFTSCEVCAVTVCYVCSRQCEGQRCQSTAVDQGGGRRVCATCCMEVGVEGRVWCLPCYNNHDDDANERGVHVIGKNKKELLTERVGMIAAWLDQCGSGSTEETM